MSTMHLLKEVANNHTAPASPLHDLQPQQLIIPPYVEQPVTTILDRIAAQRGQHQPERDAIKGCAHGVEPLIASKITARWVTRHELIRRRVHQRPSSVCEVNCKNAVWHHRHIVSTTSSPPHRLHHIVSTTSSQHIVLTHRQWMT